MAPTYIQHNPNVPTGRAAFVEFFSRIRKPEPIKAEWKDKPLLSIVSGSNVFYMFKRMPRTRTTNRRPIRRTGSTWCAWTTGSSRSTGTRRSRTKERRTKERRTKN